MWGETFASPFFFPPESFPFMDHSFLCFAMTVQRRWSVLTLCGVFYGLVIPEFFLPASLVESSDFTPNLQRQELTLTGVE